jgi:hypothetical protein
MSATKIVIQTGFTSWALSRKLWNSALPFSQKYVGTYVYREGSQNVLSFMGRTQKVTLVNRQLYLNALPLIAESEATFESSGAVAEFFLDAQGAVTRLVLTQTEGNATFDLKR